MKYRFTLIVLMTVSLPLIVKAEAGYCHYDKQVIDNITCFGAAYLNGTTVTGKVNVFGPLTINKATVNQLTVKGELHSTNSTINGNATVYGPVFAVNSQFKKDLFSATNYLELVNSHIAGNITEKSSSETGTIKLVKGSSIANNINFSARSGVVKLDSHSKVMGKITNGITQSIG